MEYKKIKEINEYKSESINPMKTPDTMYELYSVPFFTTGHPEYLYGSEIGSSKVIVQKNDILVCKINPRINRVWVVSDESNYQSIASSEWIVVRNAQYNPYFLAWYFRTPMFQQLMTSEVTGIGGSLTRAQPKRVAEYPVPVLSRERQDKIVSILNRLESIKRERKSELDLLDSLVKARFVELFGDLKINSKKWPVKSFTDIAKIDTKMIHDFRGYEAYPHIGIDSISKETGELHGYRTVKEDNIISGKYIFTPKHIIYSKIRPNLNKVAMPNFSGVCSADAYPILANEKECNREFLTYTLRSKVFLDYILMFAKRTNLPKVNKEQIEGFYCPIPSLYLQEKFKEILNVVDKSKIAIDSCIIIIEKALQSRYHYVWGICHDQF